MLLDGHLEARQWAHAYGETFFVSLSQFRRIYQRSVDRVAVYKSLESFALSLYIPEKF